MCCQINIHISFHFHFKEEDYILIWIREVLLNYSPHLDLLYCTFAMQWFYLGKNYFAVTPSMVKRQILIATSTIHFYGNGTYHGKHVQLGTKFST